MKLCKYRFYGSIEVYNVIEGEGMKVFMDYNQRQILRKLFESYHCPDSMRRPTLT
jgi:hypothetical protein